MHRDMGRFFDEIIYKRELAHRHPDVRLEVCIEIVHGTFRKLQFLDVLVDGGAPFEFKCAEAIIPRHSSQLLNYMLQLELAHGKLVNVATDSVEHQFVNTTLRYEDRVCFAIGDDQWNQRPAGAERFRQALTDVP
jgi:GxxExxY protein